MGMGVYLRCKEGGMALAHELIQIQSVEHGKIK